MQGAAEPRQKEPAAASLRGFLHSATMATETYSGKWAPTAGRYNIAVDAALQAHRNEVAALMYRCGGPARSPCAARVQCDLQPLAPAQGVPDDVR